MIVIQYTWYLKCVAKCKILQDNSCNNSVGVVSEYCIRNADMFFYLQPKTCCKLEVGMTAGIIITEHRYYLFVFCKEAFSGSTDSRQTR